MHIRSIPEFLAGEIAHTKEIRGAFSALAADPSLSPGRRAAAREVAQFLVRKQQALEDGLAARLAARNGAGSPRPRNDGRLPHPGHDDRLPAKAGSMVALVRAAFGK